MPYANNQVVIADGRITLYQREDVKNPVWQCRITMKDVRGYIKRSTGETDIGKATVVAINLLGELEHRSANDQPLSAKKFKDVAAAYLRDAHTRWKEGRNSVARYDIIKGTLNRYFIPYFGKRDITKIKKKDLMDYRAWRQSYWTTGLGKDLTIYHNIKPSSATLKQEWTILRGVFPPRHAAGLRIAARDAHAGGPTLSALSAAQHSIFLPHLAQGRFPFHGLLGCGECVRGLVADQRQGAILVRFKHGLAAWSVRNGLDKSVHHCVNGRSLALDPVIIGDDDD